MDVRQLECFRVVAELQHVTRAAAELGMPQPALSRMMTRMQGELGVALFEQAGRSIQLTPAGAAFLRRTQRILSEYGDARREVSDIARGESGVIALGFLRSLELEYVPRLVREFCSGSPGARFVFMQHRASELAEHLENGELDFCFTVAPLRNPNVVWNAVVDQRLYLSVPETHRLAHRTSVRIEDLVSEAFVSSRPGHGTRGMFDQMCSAAGFSPHIAYEGDETNGLLAFVAAGFGVSIGPDHPMRPGVRVIAIDNPAAHRTLGLAWMEDHYLSSVAQAFRTFTLTRAEKDLGR
jgi:DNA-binding transcriptional LysR family regulator